MRSGTAVMVGALALVTGCATTNTADDVALGADGGVDAAPPDESALDGGRDAATAPDAAEPLDAAGPSDAGRTRADTATDAGPTPPTFTYVIDAYDAPSMPRGPRMDETPGLDLDDRVSVEGGTGTCEDVVQDFVSPDGVPGVDNQLVGSLAGLLGAFVSGFELQSLLDDDIATGRRLLAIQLNDLDSFEEDADVRVNLFLVTPEGCASVCAPPGGVVSAGARWARSAGAPLATALPAEITGGRLHVLTDTFPISFDTGGGAVTLVLRDVILEGDVSAFGLERGVIAGGIRVDDLVVLADSIMPGIGDTARGILQDLADLQPSAGDPLVCEDLSAAMGMTAVPGTVL